MYARYRSTHGEDPYGRLLESLVASTFPSHVQRSTEDLVDALTMEFLSTKQFRLGPMPRPESHVKMRDVIRTAVRFDRPLPILLPSAALKADHSGMSGNIDLAELSMLRVLQCLNDRISALYPPGTQMRMRMEDLTEDVISSPLDPRSTYYTETYIKQLDTLRGLLGLDFLTLVPESSLVSRDAFYSEAQQFTPVFVNYLLNRDNSVGLEAGHELVKANWYGGVSRELEEALLRTYSRLYPDRQEDWYYMMASYLSTILARRQLMAIGDDPAWEGLRLEISFAQPLPDAPPISTRVLYRTVPRSHSSFHLPFWATRGYARISDEDEVTIALMNGSAVEGLHEGFIDFNQEGGQHVRVRADYVLE